MDENRANFPLGTFTVKYTLADCLELLDIYRGEAKSNKGRIVEKWTQYYDRVILPLKDLLDKNGEVTSAAVEDVLHGFLDVEEYNLAYLTDLKKVPLFINNKQCRRIVKWRLKIVK